MINLNRRTVLKRAAAGSASAMAAGLLPFKAFGEEVPKRGGDLRIALVGGSPADSMEAHISLTPTDQFTIAILYAPLFTISRKGTIEKHLAESLESNKTATAWTLRLVDAYFHDGRKITAGDVIATFRRILNPNSPMPGAPGLRALDVSEMRALDDRTVYLPMVAPFGVLPDFLSIYHMYSIVPADFDPQKPVGSGPFKVKSFTPGQRAVFERFDDYFKGPSHIDTLTLVTSFADETAAFNALRSNEVDIFSQAPLSLARSVENSSAGFSALVSKPAQAVPFTMRCDLAPFNIPDVRTAFKLMVNREQIIELALNGYGAVANDLFSPADPDFNHSLKRSYDPEKARTLLRKAGLENLEVDLVTADIAAGSVLSALVLSQQAKAAGVTVNVKKLNTNVFWNEGYMTAPFCQSFWGYSPYITQVAQCMLPGAAYDETRWHDETYQRYYSAAQSTLDTQKRHEIVTAMQEMEFDSGGYIIPSYNVIVDLLDAKVRGLQPSANGRACGSFAFDEVWIA